MNRIKVKLPEAVHFTTEIAVRITDVNYGNHLGNDKVLSICHEARVQLFKHFGFEELNIDGLGVIMSDAAIQFLKEAKYGDSLIVDIAIDNISKCTFDLFYHLKIAATNITAFKVKTGMVFYNYELSKIALTPLIFKNKFLL